MIEKRKQAKRKSIWPIKSNSLPSMRVSKKRSGWTYCACCEQKIVEGDIAYVIYPKLSTSNLWIHIGCLDTLYKELNSIKKNNIKRIMAEQLCPEIKTADKL
jgi:hypothetical protein